jgi:alpha-ribazole phosphatase
MATKLILVRHGQTAWNASGRFMGQTDIPLNETGLRQAAAVARRLQASRPRAIYASDLRRAWQTAQAIQSAISEIPPPLIAEPALREMCFGDWQGLTYPEIQSKYPRLLQEWEADRLHTSPPSGESLLQMSRRVLAAVDQITHAHPDQTLILVAHGGPLEAYLSHCLGLSLERSWQITLANASLSELQLYPEGAILTVFNDVCHLEEA